MAKAPKTTTAPTGQIAPFGLRMLPELREQIEAAARQSGRSMNSEIVSRLQQTFEGRQDPDWQLRIAIHTNAARLELLSEHELMLKVHIDALKSAALQEAEDSAMAAELKADLDASHQELGELDERRTVLLKEEFDLQKSKREADRENVELLDKIADASMQKDLQALHAFEVRTGAPVGSSKAIVLDANAKQEMMAALYANESPLEAKKPGLEDTKVVAGDVQVGLLDLIKLAFSAGRESQENGTATKDLMKLLAIKSPKK